MRVKIQGEGVGEGSFHVVVGIVGESEQPSIEQPEMEEER